MPNQNDKVYQFASLSDYSLKQRISIRLADIVFFVFIKILGSLTRFEIRGIEHLEAIKSAGNLPIICFWHDRIILGTYFFRDHGIVVMSSHSFDGEYTARVIQRFGYGSIRGSSTRGGTRALIKMVKSMRSGKATAFSVDGPRGPRYEAKPGAVILAKKTGNPIVPFAVQSRRFWTINSWDKMHIPWPFSRAVAIIGEPIFVDANADDAETQAKLMEVQRYLDSLNEECET